MNTFLAAIVVLGFGLVLYFADRYVPYNMDEFSLYHTLACKHYPNNAWHVFRVGCDTFDIRLPFTDHYLPLREYTYMGSTTSLYYWPVYTVWPHRVSVRFMGMLFLVVEAWLLSRLFQHRFIVMLAGLVIFFPYFFQHLIDTGVVGFQVSLLLVTFLLLRKWLLAQRFEYMLILVVLAFVGVGTKLTYIWLLPALGMFLVFEWFQLPQIKRKSQVLLTQASVGLVLLALFLLGWFFAVDRSGMPVYKELFSDNRTQISSIKDFLFYFHPHILSHSQVVKALLNPLEATQRIYVVEEGSPWTYVYASFLLLTMPAFIIYGRLLRRVTYKNLKRSFFWYAVFWLTMVVIYRTGRSWSMHHVILAFPLLIASFLELAKPLWKPVNRKLFILWCVVFIGFNFYCFTVFNQQPVRASDDRSTLAINKILADSELANDYIYVVIDWGMYYHQSLFGNKNQSVVYFEPLDTNEKITTLKQLANNHNRKLLFIYNTLEEQSDMELLNEAFELAPCQLLPGESVWQLLLEVKGHDTTICFKDSL